MSQDQRTVVIGISGCIAAYKACEIIRGLQKAQVRVKVVMTEHATHFVDPLTFRALTHEPVAIGLFDDPQDPIHHISLAQEADVLLLAPATANVMAKAAHGIADDLLSTTILATTAPILIAPAMNVHMYENPATQANMQTLRQRGCTFVEADEGYLACGDVGRGRLAEPARIVEVALAKLGELEGAPLAPAGAPTAFSTASSDANPLTNNENQTATSAAATSGTSAPAGVPAQDLQGVRIMITAGPTVEPIDPVRYITNRSSGKFGYALATAAAARGASVTLISGPVALPAPDQVAMVYVESARDMLAAAEQAFSECDIALFSAAVADVRPAHASDLKLKKGINDAELSSIALTENPDILATLGHAKTNQIVVGFAAETHDVIENAQKKLKKKNADLIVANEVGSNKTFGKDDDEIWIVSPNGIDHFESAPKTDLAHRILDKAQSLLA